MSSRRQEMPIVGIDKPSGAFIGADGKRYFEVESDIFVLDCSIEGSVIEDGVIGFHGSGSHGGHIVLKPFYERRDSTWVNLYTGIAYV